MPTAVQFRRGTTAQHSTFTGATGEVTVDTDRKTVVVHDGATAGGSPVAALNTANTWGGAQTFNGAVLLNGAGGSVDTRVRGAVATHLLYASASNDRIGLNQSSPAGRLDVNGNYCSAITAVSALDIDCSTANYFIKTISADSTFTFSNPPASRVYGFMLELTHTSGIVTWPTTVKWPGDVAPTLTIGKTHLFFFVTDDGGTRWRGGSNINYTN